MGPWLVFLRRITSRSLCDFIDGNDRLVSMPFPSAKVTQADLPKQISRCNTAMHHMSSSCGSFLYFLSDLYPIEADAMSKRGKPNL